MQEKHFPKSQKIPTTCSFWLIDLNTLSVSLKEVFSVDISCLKPGVDPGFVCPEACENLGPFL